MQPRSPRAAARRTAPRPRRTPKTRSDPSSDNTNTTRPPLKTDQAIEAAIKALVETAPPLSQETRERLADLLSASRRRIRP
jgi:hypothetical protein